VGRKKRTDTPVDGNQPWYAAGLRFGCQPDCGACCTNHDDYAYVYLDNDEPERIAAFLGLSTAELVERFTTTDDEFVVLKMDHPDCPFLSGKQCSVYPVRPVQCRTFPFWEENLLDSSRWNRLRQFCPGIDEGESHSLPVIQDHLSARKP
jgi:Fe-S-cluster containining protein